MEQRIVEVLEEITKALRLLEEAIPSDSSDYWSAHGSMHRRTIRELGECLNDIENRVETIKGVMKTF